MSCLSLIRIARATAVVVCGGVVPGATAQDPVTIGLEQATLDSLGARLRSFSPRSGPPGTVVTLHVTDMGIQSPYRIGVGAMRFGFEEVGWILSDNEGGFTFQITIPAWARKDLTHLFIVFDPYFNPLALSELFHVTGPDGTVSREGRIVGDADDCKALRGIDGALYGLTGDLGAFGAGADVVVEGPINESTRCGGRATIDVSAIRPVG